MAHKSRSLFNWLTDRAAGVFLHPTALPGDFGIGTLGSEARHFVDFLREAGMSYWQVCPLGPTSFGDSPYQGPSAFAGNPYLIDVLALCEHGLVRQDVLGPLLFLPQDHVDFGGIYKVKRPILRKAYEKFAQSKKQNLPYGDFAKFKEANARWLEPFALFQALKDHFGGHSWVDWPEEYASLHAAEKSPLRHKLEADIDAQRFYQYVFFGQWREMRTYALKHGISIIGDIPIFVALDSADVWANPDLFQFDKQKHQPKAVAGCPPDYFSADGQLWGNPLYDWDALERTGYKWWLERLNMCFELCDVVRIDHFRGFDSYWSIPAGSATARIGEWKRGPGIGFFETVHKEFPDAKIIAEDLGDINDDVRALLKDTGLPGMAVLQFAFGGKADNLYLPHNLVANQILYPGTHDNDTTRGWYHAAGIDIQDHVRRYLRVSGDEIAWDFIRASYAAVSRLTVFPLQDLLSLDSRARFNTPGVAQGNWSWRYSPTQLDGLRRSTAAYLRELGGLYGRLPNF